MDWIKARRVPLLLVAAALLALVAIWRATQGQWLGVFLPVVVVALAVQQARAEREGR